MQLKPEEISKVIRSQIKYYENAIQQNETGTILMVGDGIARASGLVNCMSGELLEFEDGSFGMAQNLEENSVSIVIFGSDENIGEGQTVKRTGKVVSVPVGDAMYKQKHLFILNIMFLFFTFTKTFFSWKENTNRDCMTPVIYFLIYFFIKNLHRIQSF